MESQVFDAEKFAKICNLMNGTPFDAERDNARGKAEALARAAGLTFEEAVQVACGVECKDTSESAATYNPFEGFADWMEAQEPGYKARAAEEYRRKQEADMKERSELIDRYGSKEAVFAPCEKEKFIKESCKNLANIDEEYGYVSNLDGWDSLSKWEDLPESVRTAVSQAYKIPNSVEGCWDEILYWSKKYHERHLFEQDYEHDLEVLARIVVLEELILSLPAKRPEDVFARLARFEDLWSGGGAADIEGAFIKQFREDIAFLSNGVQVGRHVPYSNAQKRDAVLEYLTCPERSELSDREIARIVGVSPQTVNNWRKRIAVQFRRDQ